MQELNTPSIVHHSVGGKSRWSVLALGMMLAACQAEQAQSAAVAEPAAASAPAAAMEASAPAQAAPVERVPVPTKQVLAPVTGDVDPEAPILDVDGNPYRPDDSYNRANLRPEYDKCVDASDAVTPALQACGDEEYQWQRQRMIAALNIIGAGPDSVAKDKLMDEQDAYLNDTDRYCRFDPDTQGQGQMLDAQSCRINRLANRADALEKLISK